MVRWSTGITCIIHVSLLFVTIALAPLHTVAGRHSRQIFLSEIDATVDLQTKCGMYRQKVFCLSLHLCNKYCSQQCSKISSFELRNLQILSPEERRIQKLRHDVPLDTNLLINYYDIEYAINIDDRNTEDYLFGKFSSFKMEGVKPAFCGEYFTLEMPIYPIKESNSNGIQFLHKLYFQNYRDVYTHSVCNYKCIFGCRRVRYDEEIMNEMLIRNMSDLHVYQCDRYINILKCFGDVLYLWNTFLFPCK